MASMFGGQAPGGAAAQEKLTDEQEEQVAGLTLSMNLNLSACYIKEEKWEKASDRAGKVLEKHPENVWRGSCPVFLVSCFLLILLTLVRTLQPGQGPV